MLDMLTCNYDLTWMNSAVVLCETANFGVNPIPSKYKANITDTKNNTNVFYI